MSSSNHTPAMTDGLKDCPTVGRNSVEMGWGAPPIKEQHPVLHDQAAEQFDADNDAISRLLLRGLLTQSQAATARKKYVEKVASSIRATLTARAGV